MSITHETERDSLPVHVDMCADRYKGVEKRLSRIELVTWAIVVLLLFGEGTVTDLVKRLLGIG